MNAMASLKKGGWCSRPSKQLLITGSARHGLNWHASPRPYEETVSVSICNVLTLPFVSFPGRIIWFICEKVLIHLNHNIRADSPEFCDL